MFIEIYEHKIRIPVDIQMTVGILKLFSLLRCNFEELRNFVVYFMWENIKFLLGKRLHKKYALLKRVNSTVKWIKLKFYERIKHRIMYKARRMLPKLPN